MSAAGRARGRPAGARAGVLPGGLAPVPVAQEDADAVHAAAAIEDVEAEPVRVEASVVSVDGRKVTVTCGVLTPPETVHAEGAGLFLQPR
jgi:transcription antitermination factor NusG